MGNKLPVWSKSKVDTASIKSSLFDYTVKTLEGEETSLSKYKGCNALLIVNVASNCGLAKQQYTGLVELRNILQNEGKFEVLAFPCSQFANQEAGTPEDIRRYISQFNVEFPVFEKLMVNGEDIHPVYAYLKYAFQYDGYQLNYYRYNSPSLSQVKNGVTTLNPLRWNFGKFLIDAEGHVVQYYSGSTPPLDLLQDIRQVGSTTHSKKITSTNNHR